MIRVIVLSPDASQPEIATVQSLQDLRAMLGGEEVDVKCVRALPDGYELCALWNLQARARPNIIIDDAQLYGTVAFAVYDETARAYIDPTRAAQRAILAEARIYARSRHGNGER